MDREYCNFCYGRGIVECECTGGDGREFADDDCYTCYGTGFHSCPVCDGTGILYEE